MGVSLFMGHDVHVLYGVRLSVCLSQHEPTATNPLYYLVKNQYPKTSNILKLMIIHNVHIRGVLLRARRAEDIDRFRRANASSATLSAYVGS